MSLANIILVIKSFKDHKGRKGQVGGSLPKGAPSYAQDSPYAQNTPSAIQQFEHDNYDLPQEHGLMITENGSHYKIDGSSGGINISTVSQFMRGSILTHNHPIYGQRGKHKGEVIVVPGFSPMDIGVFAKYGLKELRAVDERYVYVMRRNSDNINLLSDVMAHTTVIDGYSMVRSRNVAQARAKIISVNQANVNICIDFGARMAKKFDSTFTVYDRHTGEIVNGIDAEAYYKSKNNGAG